MGGLRMAMAGAMLLLAGASLASTPGHVGARVYSLAHVAGSPDVVFAAGEGAYKSVDGGRTWQVLADIPASAHVSATAVDPHAAGRVLVFTSGAAEAATYYESLDQGASWRKHAVHDAARPMPAKHAQFGGFAAHGRTPGLWLAVYGEAAYRTATEGRSWSQVVGLPGAVTQVLAQGGFFHALAAGGAWSSPDGEAWTRQDLPPESKVEQLAALGDGRLAARTVQGWWLGGEAQAWEPAEFLSTYERRAGRTGIELPPGVPADRLIDRCRVQASPANAQVLVARCSDHLKSLTISIDFGTVLRSTDGGRNWISAAGPGLPERWFATAIALHPGDQRRMLAAWVSGELYSTDDGGASWQASGTGLTWPMRLPHGWYGHEYLRETPLAQALLLRDRAAIAAVIAAGADANAVGRSGRTPLEWALEAGGSSRDETDALYWELRSRGAKVPAPGKAHEDLIEHAVRNATATVVEDLMRAGWKLSGSYLDGRMVSLRRFVSACPTWGPTAGACDSKLVDRPLGHWVDLHLAQSTPGANAVLLEDLIRIGETALAQRVAEFDGGRYPAAQVASLLGELPPEARALRASIVRPRAMTHPELGDIDRIVDVLLKQNGGMELAIQVLRRHGNQMGYLLAGRVGWMASQGEPEKAMRLLRESGVRLSREDRDFLSDRLNAGCSVDRLDRAMRLGFKLRPSDGLGMSTMRNALGACKHKSASDTDAYVERLHRAGQRLPPHEWVDLKKEERAVLLRSSRGADYARLGDYRAGIGINLEYPGVVHAVHPGYPAEQAGIRPGDAIARIDGKDMRASQHITGFLRGEPGTTVNVTVVRAGRTLDFVLRRRALESLLEPEK